ncbi:hypothetical protein [Planobispora rosea]|uniref:hypothetical protein n=1 Tax=Planobispora rosea TaxID=35762 RepID=UPI00083A375C|nr:hypothetical protein [Planobispora rosea]
MLLRAVPGRRAIITYADRSLIDPLLASAMEDLGRQLAQPYEWREDGPAEDPAVELRFHRTRRVPGGRLVAAELEHGIIHLLIDRSLIAPGLAAAMAAHGTAMTRLMMRR